jgi:CubicO group peptidase (beta-lactamase class C family)
VPSKQGMSCEPVCGHVEDGWGAVADAFSANFERYDDVGAACAVYHRGRAVVDLWGGTADVKTGRPWRAETIACMNSATKGATVVCALLLAQRGALDLDAPITAVWPEFAAGGKEAITLRMVLAHRAGLARIDGLGADEASDRDRVLAALAAQTPNWEPGTAQGYHVTSMGWITGEVVRRVSGQTLGHFFAKEIATPLGLDLWIGLPEQQEGRYAPFVEFDPEERALLKAAMTGDTLAAQVLGSSHIYELDLLANSRPFRQLELPFVNGIGTARALARMYAATHQSVSGHRLLTDETITDALIVQSIPGEHDLIISGERRYGTGLLVTPSLWADTGPRAYGHDGAGGALGMADPDVGLSFAYVSNRMIFIGQPYDRAGRLLDSVYQCAQHN